VAAPRLLYPDGRPQPNVYRRFPNLLTLFVDFCAPVGHALAHAPGLHPYVLPPGARGRRAVAHATGAALAVRRRAYDDAGPLDEGYFLYLEETEWQRRVRRSGWSVESVPEACVVHRVRGGGEAAEVPSPHYLPSAYRYLRAQGTSETAIDVTLVAGAVTSQLALRAVAALSSSRRRSALRQAEGFRDVVRYVRRRRSARGGSG
jgi:GT2 family glycosyltransferase